MKTTQVLAALCISAAMAASLCAAIPMDSAPVLPHTMKRFDGFKVIQVALDEASAPAALAFLQDEVLADFWAAFPGHRYDFMVSPRQLALVRDAGLAFEILDDDVQDDLDAEAARIRTRRAAPQGIDFIDEYHTYEEIVEWFTALAAANPALCRLTPSIGKTFEGNDILAIEIGSGNRTFLVDAQFHAREWITGASAVFIADYMVNHYDADARVRDFLAEFTLVLIPVVNVDGYKYTWDQDRLWRKNRSTNPGSNCIGTDSNRNFCHSSDAAPTSCDLWGTAGASSNPCSDTYRGAAPESEDEVKAFMAFFRSLSNVQAFLTLHSYGNLWLRSWGHTSNDAPDEEFIGPLGERTCEVMKAVNGNSYDNIKSISLYATTGTTGDGITSLRNGVWAYTPELTGPFFTPPASNIRPQGEELVEGILYMGEEIARLRN